MIDLKLLRGSSTTTPTAAAYVGPIGEALIDTDTFCIRVQDGSTAGGHEICPITAGTPWARDPVTTGTSHTVTFTSASTITYWSSATSGAKTTDIPGAATGNAGYQWIDKTTLGNGDAHTIVPASGTVDGVGTYSFSDFKTAISMISDGVSNWMIV
jgi:hypothetical protein